MSEHGPSGIDAWQEQEQASTAVGDGKDFYFDLVGVHVENGVITFLILLLGCNALLTIVLLIAHHRTDVYVIPGTKDVGWTQVLWGREVDAPTLARIREMERLRLLKEERQQEQMGLDTSGLP
ncbi:MAG: hypothetical protein ACOCXA_05100, partial [Planctomycetota bacterium]